MTNNPTPKEPQAVFDFDLTAAAEHIAILTGERDPTMSFRVVAESPEAKAKLAKLPPEKRRQVRMNYPGTLSELAPTLKRKNREGFAVYVLPAATDGTGARKENIKAVRALVLDLDGAPLPQKWEVEPHLILETSPDRFQCFFAIVPSADFALCEELSRRLAARYGGDASATDITHVFRLAGFIHQKGEPFTVRIVKAVDPAEVRRLPLDRFDFLPELPPRGVAAGHASGGLDAEGAALLFAHLDASAFNSEETWRPLAMSLHDACGGDDEVRDLFLEWCRTDPSYDDDVTQQKNHVRWGSFNTGKESRITAGTLHKICRDHDMPSDVMEKVFPRIDAQEDFADAGDDVAFDDGFADAKPKAPSRFKAVPLSFLRTLPAPKYLVDGLISEGGLFELYGKEKSGKTWAALDMALSIATGTDFHGLETTKGRVLYVIGEGNRRRFGYRIEGWITARGKHLEPAVETGFAVLALPMHCDAAAEVKEFLAANPGQWSMIVIDTLMRNMSGHISDPKDMAAFVRGCDSMREKTGAAVLVLHHEGKDKTKGGMGSTNLAAAVDGILYFARRGKRQRVLSVAVLRDGNDDLPHMVFELERVPLKISMDPDDGEDIDSAALKLIGREAKGDDDNASEDNEESKQEALRLTREGEPWRMRYDAGQAWIGRPIATAYELDADNHDDRKRINGLIKEMLGRGDLREGHVKDGHGHRRRAIFADWNFG